MSLGTEVSVELNEFPHACEKFETPLTKPIEVIDVKNKSAWKIEKSAPNVVKNKAARGKAKRK